MITRNLWSSFYIKVPSNWWRPTKNDETPKQSWKATSSLAFIIPLCSWRKLIIKVETPKQSLQGIYSPGRNWCALQLMKTYYKSWSPKKSWQSIYIAIYITYIYGIHHWNFLRSSYRKLAWVGFEPTTTEFRSDTLSLSLTLSLYIYSTYKRCII